MDRSSKILVTGGQGWIGKKLGAYLAESGFDNVFSLAGSRSGIDLGLDSTLGWAFNVNPEIVVHLATRFPTKENCLEYPASLMFENMFVTAKVMEEARMNGCKKFIMVWDSCCYPEHQILPHKESELWEGAPFWTQRYYGTAAKAAMELNMAYSTQYEDFTGINLIFPEVYGPNSRFNPNRNSVIESVITNIAAAKEYEYDLPVQASSKCTRDFLYVDDAVRAIHHAIEYTHEPNTFNVSQGDDISIKELHELVAELYEYKKEILWEETALDIKERTFLDISLIKKEIGWHPQTSMKEGLKETIKWHKENLKVTFVSKDSLLVK